MMGLGASMPGLPYSSSEQSPYSSISMENFYNPLVSNIYKNAGHDMAIVGEPCNVDAHAKILASFMTMLCHDFVYTCTVHTDCDCTVV